MGRGRHAAQGEARPHRRAVSTLLIVVGVALLAIAAWLWLSKQWQYHEQDVENEKLATYAQLPQTNDGPPTVDWAGLKAVNDDVVGWVYIPNTSINYPVYQGETNQTYLRMDAEGNYSIGGQVFLDYENTAPGMVDQQSVVYGHHLRNGAMFKHVADMATQSTFDDTPTVWYLTESQSYELEPVFLYHTTGDDTGVRELRTSTDEEFRQYLLERLGEAVSRRSDAEDVIARTSHVLSLVTCQYADQNGRAVLVCVPKVEAAGV